MLSDKIANNFLVERQIFQLLGNHPRIVRHGNLQRYLDDKFETISSTVRNKWCIQAVESIAYIHSCGVIHSDIRPENFLVHATSPTSLDLWLCDFGGSTCEELGLDGGHLPDSGFYDPKSQPESSTHTDIFSIGSVIYTILTGHWPYRSSGPFRTGDEMEEYRQKVDDLFELGRFPDVNRLFAGKIMMKCWLNDYASADDLFREISLLNE
ncbi:Calcium/calmodulin-dependent protein kinase type 1 [Metarhizium anisopliae]